MKSFQDFAPYNRLQWEPNGSREFQCKLQTVQRALNENMDILDDMGVSKLSAIFF